MSHQHFTKSYPLTRNIHVDKFGLTNTAWAIDDIPEDEFLVITKANENGATYELERPKRPEVNNENQTVTVYDEATAKLYTIERRDHIAIWQRVPASTELY